jgi:hypothetical protein
VAVVRNADRVQVRVMPDTSRFPSDLRDELRSIERTLSITVPVVADLDRLRDLMRAQLAALRAERITVQVNADLDRLRTTLLAPRPPLVVPARVDADPDALDGLRASLTALGRDSGGAVGAVGGLSRTVGGLGTAALTAVPNVAGLVASLAQMAPAAAVAAPAMLAVGTAGAAAAIGMSGLGNALGGDADAMADLAPSARSFVTELRSMRGAFDELRRDVQEELFIELDDVLRTTAEATMPVFRDSLLNSARSLGNMAAGAALAAAELAEDGTLGRALDSANTILSNLAGVPARVVRGLGQIAAAAVPASNASPQARRPPSGTYQSE